MAYFHTIVGQLKIKTIHRKLISIERLDQKKNSTIHENKKKTQTTKNKFHYYALHTKL